jgi:hypothetical protein
MATTQPIVSTSEYDDNIDDYFSRTNKDDFQQQTFIYPEQQQQQHKPRQPITKSKPRKNKRSGKDFGFSYLIN